MDCLISGSNNLIRDDARKVVGFFNTWWGTNFMFPPCLQAQLNNQGLVKFRETPESFQQLSERCGQRLSVLVIKALDAPWTYFVIYISLGQTIFTVECFLQTVCFDVSTDWKM